MFLSAAAIVPVLIHLWNRKPGKIMKVGSIQLLKTATVRHARSLRIADWLLLLLRCLLILLLAVLLAKPVWQRTIAREHRGWIILEDGAYPHFQTEIDSLLASGCQLRRFDAAFTRIQIKHLPAGDTTTTAYWQLLKTLEAQLPPDFPLYVYSGNQQRRFYGRRPALRLNLHWKVYTSADTLHNWQAYTYPLASGEEMVLTGRSSASGTYYTQQATPAAGGEPLRICVYTDHYKQDAAALIYALQTVQQYTGRKMTIATTKPAGEQYDWICWLSDAEAPAPAHGKLLKYAAGKALPTNANVATVNILKYIPAATGDSVALYDSYHHPIVTYNGNVYTLYTHINTAWCSLPDDGLFPLLLLKTLLPVPPAGIHDMRAVDAQQLLAANGAAADTPAPGHSDAKRNDRQRAAAPQRRNLPNDTTDLQTLCWMILFLLFAVERYLALKTPKTHDYGKAGI